jgi:hypothetical protein
LSEVKLPGTTSLREIIDKFKEKIECGIIPPDPARVFEAILRVPVEAEHLLPIPPVVEYVHSSFTKPLVDSLPRLPMTSEVHEFQWMKWVKEEFKL